MCIRGEEKTQVKVEDKSSITKKKEMKMENKRKVERRVGNKELTI